MKTIRANEFSLAPEVFAASLKHAQEDGVTVVRMTYEFPPRGLVRAEFELRLTRLNGNNLPRNTRPIRKV